MMFSVGKCFDGVILVPMKLHWGWHISYICHPVSSKLLIASLATSLDLAVTQSAKGVTLTYWRSICAGFTLIFMCHVHASSFVCLTSGMAKVGVVIPESYL
jgi:hypothetical protein